MADIGNPKPAQIAKALGVSKRTVERWNSTKPPRMAMLRLWWLSRHGHSEWDAEMHNRTQMAVSTYKGLWREVRDLREQVVNGGVSVVVSLHGVRAEEGEPGRTAGD